jgi:hypothetical protein
MADIRSRLAEQRRIMLGGFKRIDIDGITDYEINNLGVVRNLKTEKVLKHQIRNGYKSVALYGEGKKIRNFYVHKLLRHCLEKYIEIDDIKSFKVIKKSAQEEEIEAFNLPMKIWRMEQERMNLKCHLEHQEY